MTDQFADINLYAIIWTGIIIILSYILIRFIDKLLFYLFRKKDKAKAKLEQVIPFVNLALWVLVLFLILKLFQKDPIVGFILFFIFIVYALVLTFPIFKNVFSGILLMLEKPFQVGDVIEYSGEMVKVVKKRLYATQVLTMDQTIISIPNKLLSGQMIERKTLDSPFVPVKLTFYISEKSKLEDIRKQVEDLVKLNPYVALEQPVHIGFEQILYKDEMLFKMMVDVKVLEFENSKQFKNAMSQAIIKDLKRQGVLGFSNKD